MKNCVSVGAKSMLNSIFFNAHHSPIGAYSSFTLGYKGAKGGFASELGKPADQNIYIGVESENADEYFALPFYRDHESDIQSFDPSTSIIQKLVSLIPFADNEISREFCVGTDTWNAGDLTISIYSPIHPIPDPTLINELKKPIIPAVFIEMTIDNSLGQKRKRAFFGFDGVDPYSGCHHIREGYEGLTGIGQGRNCSICTLDENVDSAIGFSIREILGNTIIKNRKFGLGSTAVLLMSTKPGEKKTFRFVLSFYKDGIVTTGISASYYYTKYYSSKEDVAIYGLSHFDEYIELAKKHDTIINQSKLSEEQLFMMTMAVRSYYGSTQLLSTLDGPLWVVNEGEYRMINTLDLTIDQMFFEFQQNPWTVRNVLEWFAKRCIYNDNVVFPGERKLFDGGVSFSHDMGVANQYAAEGHSSYELSGLKGCFSYMTHEQLVNWSLIALVYISNTDDTSFIKKNELLLEKCLLSMVNRDHPVPEMRDGVMKLDSVLVDGGSEITTYDSLDSSLGQARGNIYLAMKCWAAYVLFEKLFEKTGKESFRQCAGVQAALCANTLVKSVNADGYIPAILDGKSKSAIIPLAEGLIYPYYAGAVDAVSESGKYKELISVIKRHIQTIFTKKYCITEDGGWKLSSTSNNTWLSKIYLNQYIVRQILDIEGEMLAPDSDKAHMSWLLDENNSYYAWSDQFVCGNVQGSRYYPRGVTSILWLT
jgi:hypothetical protein